MIVVLQRVKSAEVTVNGSVTGSCGRGLLILLGVAAGDGTADADALAAKISKLRIFEDENGKMNRSVLDIGGGALVVSNFTLLADYRHGNRPSFTGAAAPDEAKRLYGYFSAAARRVRHRRRQRHIRSRYAGEPRNDGPVTLTLDSRVLLGKAGI